MDTERLFDALAMLTGLHDIIGDLARLRQEFIGVANRAEGHLAQLEVLAAAAVQLGMSYNIVGKASGIPQERIDAVLDAQPTGVRRRADDYERLPSASSLSVRPELRDYRAPQPRISAGCRAGASVVSERRYRVPHVGRSSGRSYGAIETLLVDTGIAQAGARPGPWAQLPFLIERREHIHAMQTRWRVPSEP